MLVLNPPRCPTGRDKMSFASSISCRKRLFLSLRHPFSQDPPICRGVVSAFKRKRVLSPKRKQSGSKAKDDSPRICRKGSMSSPKSASASDFVLGLKCRICGKAYGKQALNFCTDDFGPLEVDYD